MGQGGADQLDGADQVGVDDVADLLVGKLLRRAEQAVARVAHDHIDAPELGEGAVHDLADRGRIGHVEQLGAERCRILLDQVGDLSLIHI